MKVWNRLKKTLTEDKRIKKVSQNTFLLLVLKGFAIFINLALIPLTVGVLGNYEYGVWVTMFNVVSWIQIFDFGLGNGLRNKYTESIANQDFERAKAYVSTAYIVISIVSFTMIASFLLLGPKIEWHTIFNANFNMSREIYKLISVCVIFMSIHFTLKLIGSILTADHKPALNALLMTVSNTIIFAIILFFRPLFENNLFNVGLIYMLAPAIIFLGANLYFFNTVYSSIKPSFRYFRREMAKDLFVLGGGFFVIQIAVIIIFQTDSLIISHTLSPSEVTPYNIAFRYFSVITMIFATMLTPLWSAFTEAYAKREIFWIRRILRMEMNFFVVALVIISLMLFFGKTLIDWWLGNKVNVGQNLLIGMAVYTAISIWNNIFSFLLNGVSKIRAQLYTSIIGMTINIPLSIYLAKIFGVSGVIYATCVSLSFFMIIGPIETKKALSYEE